MKRSRRRRLKKPILLFLAGLVLAGAVLVYKGVKRLTRSQWSDQKMEAAFADGKHGEAILGYADGPTRRIRYLNIGQDTSKPLVVFIHGSPSSSSFWVKMMQDKKLQARANLLAIDRPGYGGSGLGRAMVSVKEQAENVAEIIRQLRPNPNRRLVVHGSSYGGTVAARLAMDNPGLVDGLLLQSASMAPAEEFTYWISRPTNHWALRWLMPGAIRTVNMEKINHGPQLREMVPLWKNITARTVIVHGTADWLIYPPNAYFACEQLSNAEEVVHHMVANKQHDLIRTAPKLLKRYVHYLLGPMGEP